MQTHDPYLRSIVKPRRPRHVDNFRPRFRTIFLFSGELFFICFVTSFDIPTAAYGNLFVFVGFRELFLFPGAHALVWF